MSDGSGRRFVLFLGLYGIAAAGFCETPLVSCGELNRNISGQGAKMMVVDVRGASDFARGHIPGAVNAPYDGIEKAGLPREGVLVLYCGNAQCPWSKLGAKTLENAGYKNVRILEGGVLSWTAEGFVLETAAGLENKSVVTAVAGIAPSKLLKIMDDRTAGIIDTRSENDFKIAHLPGAKNIPFENLGSMFSVLSKDIEWVVYDRLPETAKAAARQMTERGFKVKELSGGLQVWSARQYPLEAGSGK